jgi:hypothetical protein
VLLGQMGVQAYWILDYGNQLYTNGSSLNGPTTPEAVAAFTAWAIAAMRHFQGQQIIWELWWGPASNQKQKRKQKTGRRGMKCDNSARNDISLQFLLSFLLFPFFLFFFLFLFCLVLSCFFGVIFL